MSFNLQTFFLFKHDENGTRVSGKCKLCLNVTIHEKYTANYRHHLQGQHPKNSGVQSFLAATSNHARVPGPGPDSSRSSTSSSTSTWSSSSCSTSSSSGSGEIKDEKMQCEDDDVTVKDDDSEDSRVTEKKRKRQLSDSKQGRLGFTVTSASNLERFQQLTAATFAKFGLPHNLVERSEFREWMAEYEKMKCEQAHKLTTRKRLRDLVLQQGESTHNEILAHLRGAVVTLAIDGWTGQTYGAKNTNILALAGGRSYLLWSDRNEDQKDSADSYLFPLVSAKIKELRETDIAVCAITTDNAANMLRIGTLLYQLPETGPIILHLSCSAHSIQLMLQEIVELEPIQQMIKKCLSLVEPFLAKNGKEWRLELRSVQKMWNPDKSPLKLVLFNSTRWLSRFHCIQRLVLLKKALKTVFCNMTFSSQYSFIHTPAFWSQMELVILPLLKAFAQATNMVQSDSASLHTLDQALVGIRKAVNDCKPSTQQACSTQAEVLFNTEANAILNDRIKQFVVANGNHYAFWAVSLLTDKKCQRWESTLTNSSTTDYDNTVAWLTHWGADVLLFYAKQLGLEGARKPKLLLIADLQYQLAEFESGLGACWRKKEFLRNFVRPIPTHSINYDESKPKSDQKEIDWLLFWNKMQNYAPDLSTVAIILLSLGITEASCERSFSIQQLTHSKVRNRLNEDIVQAEMRIRYNKHVRRVTDDDSESLESQEEMSDSDTE